MCRHGSELPGGLSRIWEITRLIVVPEKLLRYRGAPRARSFLWLNRWKHCALVKHATRTVRSTENAASMLQAGKGAGKKLCRECMLGMHSFTLCRRRALQFKSAVIGF